MHPCGGGGRNGSVERSRSVLPPLHASCLCSLGLGILFAWFHSYLSFCWLPAGDIAFRFLRYVQAQHQRKQRRQLRAQQNLSWEEIAKKYQNEEDPLGGSLVTVCDINREMLKVGKQKAVDQGHRAGESLSRRSIVSGLGSKAMHINSQVFMIQPLDV